MRSLTVIGLLPLLFSSSVQGAARVTVTNGTSLPPYKVALIKGLLDTTANVSWEIGTHIQALTEFDYPTLSPFFAAYNPPPSNPFGTSALAIVSKVISTKVNGTLPLIADGSAGDPASIGVGVVLGNWTIKPSNQQNGVTREACGRAADDQVRFLLQNVPRTPDGAISHRTDQLQLWSDFVYMVPPFLSYYGVMKKNATIIQEAYNQCRLYRQYLRQPSGLWQHIVMGSSPDPGLWATGNAWAAAGMLRTMVTILHSEYASQFLNQTNDLTFWVEEIVAASFAFQQPNNLFPNYFNSTSFSDASSVALMTSVSYRLAQLGLSMVTIPAAERARQTIYASINSKTGVLRPVVNPNAYPYEGTESPEGQAFILLMEAAWRDWVGGGGIISTPATSELPPVVGKTGASASSGVTLLWGNERFATMVALMGLFAGVFIMR